MLHITTLTNLPIIAVMDLGWMDVCLRVRDFPTSQRFYEALGFQMVEGEPDSGWEVFVRGQARIGLFVEEFMDDDSFTLNFRGGCIPEILAQLGNHQIQPIAPPVLIDERAGSLRVRDPDGHLIFFDTAPGEIHGVAQLLGPE